MDLNDLRTRLTFTFIVLSALPLAAFGLYSYIKGVEMVRDKAVSHLESVVDKDVGMINRFVTERMGDLRLFASTLEDNVAAASVRKRLISLQESLTSTKACFLLTSTARQSCEWERLRPSPPLLPGTNGFKRHYPVVSSWASI